MAEEKNDGFMDFLSGNAPTDIKPVDNVAETAPVDGNNAAAITEPVEPADNGGAQTESFFEQFNKRYQTGYKTDDEISEAFKSVARIAELDAKVKEYEPLKSKVEEYSAKEKLWLEEKAKLEEEKNPLKFFKNKDAYVAHQLSMKYPDEQVPVIMKLMTSDLTRMDKVDLLANELLLKSPDIEGGIEGAREVLLSELGVDKESKPEEWDSLTKNKINIRATDARTRLQALKDSVEIPVVKTEEEKAREITERQESLKRSWSPFLDKIEGMDKINIPDPTDATKVLETIDIPENWRKESREGLLESILESGVEPNENTLKALVREREKDFIYDNLPQLFTLWKNNIASKAVEERDKLLNNTTPPNSNVRPDGKPATANEGFDKWI